MVGPEVDVLAVRKENLPRLRCFGVINVANLTSVFVDYIYRIHYSEMTFDTLELVMHKEHC